MDKKFKYRPSHDTDIANSEEWAKAIRKMKKEKAEREEMRKNIAQLPTIGKKANGRS